VIRVKKPKRAPDILRTRGVKAARQLRKQYDAEPESHKGWSFDSGIYGEKSVKDALKEAQHDKCAFCESKVSHIAYGDVEHFRPKAGYRQGPEEPLVQPGYYWLAYVWTNLLFSCQLCNQRFKGNHFPLKDDTQRAKSHHDDVKNEQPLFIHPAIEDPSDFLKFDEHYLCAIDDNVRGKATIEALGLNRDKLVEKRGDALKKLKLLIKFRDHISSEIIKKSTPELVHQLTEIDEHLSHCTSDSGEYAAMGRAVFRPASGLDAE
jgi:uncharacterized protein (TIGR02646 family)